MHYITAKVLIIKEELDQMYNVGYPQMEIIILIVIAVNSFYLLDSGYKCELNDFGYFVQNNTFPQIAYCEVDSGLNPLF